NALHVIARELGDLIFWNTNSSDANRNENRRVTRNNNMSQDVLPKFNVTDNAPVPAHAAISRIARPDFYGRITHPDNRIECVVLFAECTGHNPACSSARARFADALIKPLPRVPSVSFGYCIQFLAANQVRVLRRLLRWIIEVGTVPAIKRNDESVVEFTAPCLRFFRVLPCVPTFNGFGGNAD